MSADKIEVAGVTFDKPGNDWAIYVMECIQEKPLAEAGKEVACLVAYAMETEQYGPFIVDMHACVHAFWARCNSAMQEGGPA